MSRISSVNLRWRWAWSIHFPERSLRCWRLSLLERVSVSKRAIPHRRIEAEAFGVVDILVAGQPAVDRLAQQGSETVPGVLPRAGVVQAAGCRLGQSESVVKFPVGEQSSVTG